MKSNLSSVLKTDSKSIRMISVVFRRNHIIVKLRGGKAPIEIGDVVSIHNMNHYIHLEETPMTVTDVSDEHMSAATTIRLELILATDSIRPRTKDVGRVVYTNGAFISATGWLSTKSYKPCESKSGHQIVEIYDLKFKLIEGQTVQLMGAGFTDKCKFKVESVGAVCTKLKAKTLDKLLEEHMRLDKVYKYPTLPIRII